MAKNVSSRQGLFDDLDFVQPSELPERTKSDQQIAEPTKTAKTKHDILDK